ncbi:MAG: GDP-mannose 4,6-dehydratase, partial [Actinomycetes bacterium]
EWEKYVKFDERYLRPTEVDALIGDASRARERLSWEAKVFTPELAKIMVDADRQELDDELSGAVAHRTRQTP